MKRLLVLLALAPIAAGCRSPESDVSISSVLPLRPSAAVVFTSNAYGEQPGGGREIFSIDADGSGLARVTVCNTEAQACDNVEVAPAPDHRRLAVRRVLDPQVGAKLFILDTGRLVEGELTLQVPQPGSPTGVVGTDRVSAVDWSLTDDILVYAAQIGDGLPDLFRTIPRPDPNLAGTGYLTFTPTVREGRPRIDPTGSVAVFERSEGDGKSEIFIFITGTNVVRVTSGGPGEGQLPGTPYRIGSDADPAYSPDGQSIVFRRLTGTGANGRGTWDLMLVRTDGSGLAPLVSGPVYRGAPDWGSRGILFTEIDTSADVARIVVVDPDGRNARTLYSTRALFEISYPRWLD